MTDMRIAKTVSITLPPDLLVKARETAQREHRTMSELFREALRRYITEEMRSKTDSMNSIREGLRQKAIELGINNEEDVVRLIHEQRRSRRA